MFLLIEDSGRSELAPGKLQASEHRERRRKGQAWPSRGTWYRESVLRVISRTGNAAREKDNRSGPPATFVYLEWDLAPAQNPKCSQMHAPGKTIDYEYFLSFASLIPTFPGWVEFPLGPADLWDSSCRRELSLSHLTFLLSKTLARWLLGIWSPGEGAGPAKQLGGWPVPQNPRESRLFVNVEVMYSLSLPDLPLLYPSYHLALYIFIIKGQETQRKSQTIWMHE